MIDLKSPPQSISADGTLPSLLGDDGSPDGVLDAESATHEECTQHPVGEG